MTALLCLCTCLDTASAQRIADALVAERLAACVNLVPGLRSVYRWEGQLERANEVLLVIKTVQARLEALQARVVALHPAELPELVVVEVNGGLAAYLDWVAECCVDVRSPEPCCIEAPSNEASVIEVASTRPRTPTGD